MAFNELGLTEDQFYSMMPRDTYIMQGHVIRKRERMWEQTREIVAEIHNMAGKVTKNNLRPEEIKKLSFDEPLQFPQWDKDDAINLIDTLTTKVIWQAS